MDSGNLRAWRRDATAGIRYRRDREAVSEEYRQHMEEKWESLIREGVPEKGIEDRILADMGSAEELAPILAEIHKPYWGYALTVLKWAMLLMIAVSLIAVHGARGSSTLFDAEDSYFSDRARDPFDRISLTEPYATFSCGDYTFLVRKAAIWESGKTFDSQQVIQDTDYSLYLQIRVFHGPFAPAFEGWGSFWAEDNLGRIYTNLYLPENPDTGGVKLLRADTGAFFETGYLEFSDISSPDIQWIDLHNDRDGRDVTLRIHLTGGADT